MPAYKPPRIPASEITPERYFRMRREVLAGALGLAAAAAFPAARAATASSTAGAAVPGNLGYTRNPRYVAMEKPNSFEDISHYNNFYEFGLDKSDPAANAGSLRTRPWSVTVAGEAAKTGTYALEDILEPAPARGAHLPAPLRRSLVDGHPLGRISARRSAAPLPADLARQVRRVHDAARSEADARPAARLPAMALRRGSADRRGHAPARIHGRRRLRPRIAEPERRAAAPACAVEVRIQERQVDRAHPLHRACAGDVLGAGCAG